MNGQNQEEENNKSIESGAVRDLNTAPGDSENGRNGERKERNDPGKLKDERDAVSTQNSPNDLKGMETAGYHYDYEAYAGFWIRFWAYLFDLLIIWGIKQIVLNPLLYIFEWETEKFFSPGTFLSAVIFYTYFVLLTKYFGQTLGKMIFGIKVIPFKGESLTWLTVIFREWIGRYLSVTVNLLYLLVAFLPRKQGIHDWFADTVVIHENYQLKKPAIHLK